MIVTELQLDHSAGTYSALQLSAQSQRQLAQWLDQQGVEHDDPAEFHCTLMYSQKPMPQAEAVQGPISATARVTGWKLLGEKATVLLIRCAVAEKMFNLFAKHGASHSWPTYIAHVTVNSEKHLESIPARIPTFALHFDWIVVKPIE